MHRTHFFQKMSPAIVAVGALFSAAAASSGHSAEINKPMVFAQAGSTGGTIGKQDKSASGGEVRVPTRVQRAPLAPKHHVAARERRAPRARKNHLSEARGSHCGKIVGTWLLPHGEATFDQNGGGRYTFLLSVTGKWTCANGIVIVTWNNGVVSRGTISHDGNSATVVNNNGKTYIARRK
jgi:hypothetical protein